MNPMMNGDQIYPETFTHICDLIKTYVHSVLYVICNTRNFGYHSGNKLMNYELCGNKKCNKNQNK